MGVYDKPFDLDQLIEKLVQSRDRLKYLEEKVAYQERVIESFLNERDPGREKREMLAHLDGEIRLLREQG